MKGLFCYDWENPEGEELCGGRGGGMFFLRSNGLFTALQEV